MSEICEVDGCDEQAHSIIESDSGAEMAACKTHVMKLIFGE